MRAGVSSPSREYVYSGSQLISTIDSSGTKYHHADHLSVRLTTDSSGNVIGQQGHFPYGEQWYASNSTTKWQFTSYERDPETGNDYAQARYDINRLGRFSSPDPIAGDTSDPQSNNRYSYVRNDPVDLADPTGMFVLGPSRPTPCGSLPMSMNRKHDSGTDSGTDSGGHDTGAADLFDSENATGDDSGDTSLPQSGGINCPYPTDGIDAMTADLLMMLQMSADIGQRQQGPTNNGGGGGLPNLPPPPVPNMPLAQPDLPPIALPFSAQCVTAALEEVVAHGEGTDGPNGYGLLVYGTVSRAAGPFSNLVGQTGTPRNPIVIDPNSLTGHPHVLVNAGVSNSTAFGRYQINAPTAAQFGITNFSPAGQDAGAATIMQHDNMIAPAMNGDFAQAMANGNRRWASLPGSNAGQPTMTMPQAASIFQNALATLPICQ